MDFSKQIKIESDLCHRKRNQEIYNRDLLKNSIYVTTDNIVGFSKKYRIKNGQSRTRKMVRK